jgi:hypothetical protein
MEAHDGDNWQPVRFITPSTEMSNRSLVRLLDDETVEAEAKLYTSSLPLLTVDPIKTVTLREYLCGRYAARLLNNEQIRLRWMQRYLTNPSARNATWYLDDIKINLWQNGCLKQVLVQDFNRELRNGNGINYGLFVGKVSPPSCNESQLSGDEEESVLNFEAHPFGDLRFRRSLVISIRNFNTETKCNDLRNVEGKLIATIVNPNVDWRVFRATVSVFGSLG